MKAPFFEDPTMKKNQASSTALTVAQGLHLISREGKYPELVTPDHGEACRAILSSCKEGRKRLRMVESGPVRFALRIMERLFLPGIILHYGLRKKYIEENTLRSLKEGFRQVVNLGAGLDTLAYRMAPSTDTVQWVEVDHPNTIRLKENFYESTGRKGENLSLLSVDFTKDELFTRLKELSTLQPRLPTLFILEGVTMYLSEEEVRSLFLTLRKVIQAPIRVIFTFLDPAIRTDYSHGPLLSLYLLLKGEPLFWKREQRQLPEFLAPLGYHLEESVDAAALRSLYLPASSQARSHEGEGIAIVHTNK